MIAGVVLAGGKSSRMGRDKSQLQIAGKSLIEHSKNTLKQAGIMNIFVSGKTGIADEINDKGPLAGICASSEFLKEFKYVLFTTVDMPLLNKQIFQHLLDNKNTQAVYIDHYFFPLFVYNSALNRSIMKQQLNNNILSIKNMLKQLEAKSLTNQWTDEAFLNVNTENDWQNFLELKQ